MTLILLIVGAGLVAQTLILSLILLELREQRMTRLLRESKRRQWVREEHQTDG